MLYRVKKARPLPGGRNRPDVLQKKVDYATWFMRHAVVNHSIFVHECGFNIWTARSHGHARMGEKAYGQICGFGGSGGFVPVVRFDVPSFSTCLLFLVINPVKSI